MKTLEQIKNDYAVSNGYEDWKEVLNTLSDFNDVLDMCITEVMKIYAMECLKLASENSYLNGSEYSRCGCEINIESIINQNNIIK